MKAYVIEGPHRGVVKEVPIPEPQEGELLVKVMAAGLCGTDGHIYQGEYYSSFPLIPGHEFAGIVVKTGPGVKYFREGQRVAADPNIFCGRCEFCKENIQNFCHDFQAIGVTRDGAFAEYVLVPESTAFDVGDLDFTAAALIEPLACVVYGQKRARPVLGAHVLIFGAGPIGLLHLQLAKRNGAATVTMVDIRPERLETARSMGADFTVIAREESERELRRLRPGGYHLVIDSTGAPSVVERAVAFVRNAGTLLVFGVCPPNARIAVSPYEIYNHRWLRSPHTLGKILRSKRCHHSVCNQSKNHDCQREQSSQGFLICTHPKSQLKSLL